MLHYQLMSLFKLIVMWNQMCFFMLKKFICTIQNKCYGKHIHTLIADQVSRLITSEINVFV